MQIVSIHIKNFKSIVDMKIHGIENALILVGKNNTGKTSVLDAIRAVAGSYEVRDGDFDEKRQNIEVSMTLKFTREDLSLFHKRGIVSQYKRFDVWKKDFCSRLPSYHDGLLPFTFIVNWQKKARYDDGHHKDNRYIKSVFPKLYYIDTGRELDQFQNDLLMFQEDEQLKKIRSGSCLFDSAKGCNHCFQCIGLIEKKPVRSLTVFETSKLLEYQLYQLNLNDFSRRINENYRKNGGFEKIRFSLDCRMDEMFKVRVTAFNEERQKDNPIGQLSNGMKSIYMMSLLEAYIEDRSKIPSVIIVEDPEIFLHPSLQKTSGEILYRLSKKNQVIFTTHSPNLLINFRGPQIRQIVLDENYHSTVKAETDIDAILNDLGYAANDFLNVGFVFIVEGKQDKSRLPLLLKKYYSEVSDGRGNLLRISIITTNSCTNIKTYANLKYMNQVYLRDQFLMIRDGDGEDREELTAQLCRYYEDRNREDVDRLPRVTRRNVLILKYYSFENYFLNPEVMTRLGVVESETEFYEILYSKWKEYLCKLRCGRKFMEVLGREPASACDLKRHIETFKIYMRGHNLYDIFYGPFKKNKTELLKNYIEIAPRDDFRDILDAIDQFPYFDSRGKG